MEDKEGESQIFTSPQIFAEYDPRTHSMGYVDTADLLGLPTDDGEEENVSLLSSHSQHVGESVDIIKKKHKDFGGKDISWLGGFSLLINNMTGPAVAAIPVVFQQAGWFTPTLCIIIMTLLSSYGCTLLCEAMANIPGNEEFDGRAELTTLAKAYFPPWGFIVVHILLYICLQSMNMAAIIISAQTMDATLIWIFKWTAALQVYPHFGFIVATLDNGNESPFPAHSTVITLGFLIVFALTIPLGYVNLDDNIIVQKITCVIMLALMCVWLVQFFFQGIDLGALPMIGHDQTQVVGTIIFNFAFAVSIPSWVNEKKPGVSINKSVWYANLLSTFFFVAIGFVGATVFPYSDSSDLLSAFYNIKLRGPIRFVSLMSVFLFPIIVLLPGIPVYSIIVRYNLLKTNWIKRRMANFLAVVLPWLVALPFYSGGDFMAMINYVSLFVNGLINFIIPFWLYLLSYKLKAQMPNTSSENVKRFKAMPMWPERTTRKLARFLIVFSIIVTVGGIITSFLPDNYSPTPTPTPAPTSSPTLLPTPSPTLP